MYSLGAKLYVVVCRSTSSAVTPTCISVSPTGDKPWYLCRGKFAAIYMQTFHFGLTSEEHYFSAINDREGEGLVFVMTEGGALRIVYLYSLYFLEQLSC